MQSNMRAALFVAAIVLLSLMIGWFTLPGEWYAGLDKPFFNPPSWLFGPVWTVLYVLIAIAGVVIWRADRNGVAMKLWVAQMVLNWLWSPAFFGLQSPELAFVIILALLAAIIAFILAARRIAPAAAWLFAPYLAWVSFATLLNGSIAWLNPPV